MFKDYFSPHQRNIVCEYKLYGKPIMKYKQTFSLVSDIDSSICNWGYEDNFKPVYLFIFFYGKIPRV